jgi:hypothetical protein
MTEATLTSGLRAALVAAGVRQTPDVPGDRDHW